MQKGCGKSILGKNKKVCLLAILLSVFNLSAYAQENCANGVDDDGDGLVDLNDVLDCSCQGIVQESSTNLFPNPSFEDYIDCPTWYAQMQTVVDWNQATTCTSDYFNSCGMMWESIPQPLPDGEGCVGSFMCTYVDNPDNPVDYFEYVGACLNTSLEAGVSYDLQFSIAANNAGPNSPLQIAPIIAGPVEVTIYGYGSCGSMPLPTQTCPLAEGWTVLGSVLYQPENIWSVQTITLVPLENIAAIMIGAPCQIDDDSYSIAGEEPYDSWMYFFYDDFMLAPTELPSDLAQSGGNCLAELVMSSAPSDLLDYQWYWEGVALVDETSNTLNLGLSNYPLGFYQMMVTNTYNGTCSILETEVVQPVDFNPLNFEMSQSAGCAPLTVQFDNGTNPEYLENMVWDFEVGSSNEVHPTFIFETPGLYSIDLTVETETGCVFSLTLENAIEVYDSAEFMISAPDVICEENAVDSIQAFYDNGSITWQDGSSGEFFPINGPGEYHAVFTNDDGCLAMDSVEVELKALPQIRATDKAGCDGSVVELYAESAAPMVYWENLSNEQTANVSVQGVYTAVAENECGSSAVDVFVELYDCACHVYIPNAFSPNGDGVNDLFRPSIECALKDYSMRIYDRWGQEVFFSNDPQQAWNGGAQKDIGYSVENNVFSYTLVYSSALNPQQALRTESGYVQLLR